MHSGGCASSTLAVFFSAAQVNVSPRNVARLSALFGSKQRQRTRAVSRFMNGSMFVGQRLGSAIRFRVDGTSCHAAIIACSVPASSAYDLGLGYCSRRLIFAASSAPPDTGGELE